MKRPNSDSDSAVVAYKRPRDSEFAIMEAKKGISGPPRSSNLESPIMLLSGHSSEVYCSKFHPGGDFLASAGMDRMILFFYVFGEECANFHAIDAAHSGAIVDMKFSHDVAGSRLHTASTDKTVGMFDVETGTRIKRMKGHTSFVNSIDSQCSTASQLVVSGSDDCFIKIWDSRRRNAVQEINNIYQVTAVAFTAQDDQIVSAGIDNQLKIWDLRKPDSPTVCMSGHTDTVTKLILSPPAPKDGQYAGIYAGSGYILSNSMDSTLRIWDVRPYATGERCVKLFRGHQHNFERNLIGCAWSPDATRVASGSADRHVYIWDVSPEMEKRAQGEVRAAPAVDNNIPLYKLPGHQGSVNDVDLHPFEPIVLSGSSDKTMYLGEIERS